MTLVLGGGGAWMVHEGFEERVVELMEEELHEVALPLEEPGLDRAGFVQFAQRMDQLNPTYRLSFGLLRPGSTEWEWGGEPLDERVTALVLGGTRPGGGELDGQRRWSSRVVGRGPLAGGELLIAVDAAPAYAAVRRSMANIGRVALFFLLLATVTALLLRGMVQRQFRTLEATCQALSLGRAGELPDGSGMPREVASLVDRLGRLLDTVRSENERGMVLISGIAHDVRTPLQVLQTEVELALLREREAHEYDAVLRSVLGELGELRRLVENLLMLSVRSTPELVERWEAFHLGQEARLRLESQGYLGRVDLFVGGETRLHGDRELVLLALCNLVSNGIQHAPPGSRVRVHVNGLEDQVELLVEDEGPGIPPEARERVFEADFRLPRDQASRRPGSGLGLAIVRRCVVLHGGRVEVLDRPTGTAVRVVLPRVGQEPSTG